MMVIVMMMMEIYKTNACHKCVTIIRFMEDDDDDTGDDDEDI